MPPDSPYDAATGESRKPVRRDPTVAPGGGGGGNPQESGGGAELVAVSEWRKMYDAEHQAPFWQHTETGEMSWEDPEAVAGADGEWWDDGAASGALVAAEESWGEEDWMDG